MEINQETINQLLSLSDTELQNTFRGIAAALGMNEHIAVLGATRFKRMLAASNPKDLERLLSSVSPQQAQQILQTVAESTNQKEGGK